MGWTTAHSLSYFYIGIAQQSDTKIYDQEIDFIKEILSNAFDADQASIDQVVKEHVIITKATIGITKIIM